MPSPPPVSALLASATEYNCATWYCNANHTPQHQTIRSQRLCILGRYGTIEIVLLLLLLLLSIMQESGYRFQQPFITS